MLLHHIFVTFYSDLNIEIHYMSLQYVTCQWTLSVTSIYSSHLSIVYSILDSSQTPPSIAVQPQCSQCRQSRLTGDDTDVHSLVIVVSQKVGKSFLGVAALITQTQQDAVQRAFTSYVLRVSPRRIWNIWTCRKVSDFPFFVGLAVELPYIKIFSLSAANRTNGVNDDLSPGRPPPLIDPFVPKRATSNTHISELWPMKANNIIHTDAVND
jgi:hypothetical protein